MSERDEDGAGENGQSGEGNDRGGREPYRKLSAEERALFLAVLRETGNRKAAAAAAIGVEPRLMDQRRAHDPELDRLWTEAVEEAHRRLSGADGPFDFAQDRPFDFAQDRPFDCAEAGPLDMIRRGKKGRLQLVSTGEGRWNVAVEERFKAVLRATGNFAAAARAVGFSESAVWDRRRKWPAFAEALEAMLEEAELKLEFRIATMGNNVGRGTVTGDCPNLPMKTGTVSKAGTVTGDCPQLSFNADFAMRFLKWREEKRRGRGRRTPEAKPPSIEAVTETILRRVEAIERHGRREAGE